MTLRRFDYAAFRAAFRAAARQYGIDSVAGATSYQVVLVRANAKRVRRGGGWWKRSRYWRYCPPYASVVEESAIRRVFAQAYAAELVYCAERRAILCDANDFPRRPARQVR